MTVRVFQGPTWACAKDGHAIALRLRYEADGPEVRVSPFCDVCRKVFLPTSMMVGREADWLMGVVQTASTAPDAPPEASKGLYE